ncbi:hypothetical protein MKW94_019263 [Papaver nudicaule]|uniref:Bet v I/Major latex protein domain-containing protein n=1 Tax=Papaver nudicaule TaxID=74823 RepID=A0AA41RV95_PAPNU|nr:hypothetical protein [Papaver nudicaule]
MVQMHRQQVEAEAKNCSADQFFCFFKGNMIKLPQIVPHTHKSVQVLEGDGISVGSVRLWKILVGTPRVEVMAKDKIKTLDDETRTVSWTLMDGDVLQRYKTFEYTVSVSPIKGNEQSCLVKWSVEYEKENEDVPVPNDYLEYAENITKSMASHLVLNKA